jgi:hypothetical protein
MFLAGSGVFEKEVAKMENELYASIGKDPFARALVSRWRFKTPVALYKRSELRVRNVCFIDHSARDAGSPVVQYTKLLTAVAFAAERRLA